jgi:pilus assembly protein FimV
VNKKTLSLAICMAITYPGVTLALGLGEIESASHLNQPFNAKIDLLSTNGTDPSQLRVKVASPSVFSRVGIDRPNYLNSLRFRSTIQNGKPVILVSSAEAIKEPFINFLLEVSWPNGQLLKEYTVLLDPPVLMQPGTSIASNTAGVRPDPVNTLQSQQQRQQQAIANQNAAREQQRQRIIAQQQQARQQQAAAPVNDGLRRPSAPLAQAAATKSRAGVGRTYRVRSGDTLYKVAQKVGYNGVRTEQMMIALFEANPTAFRRRNINNLKAGVDLRRPSVDEARRITISQARQEIKSQTSDWKSRAAPTRVASAPKAAATNNTPTPRSTAPTTSEARMEVLGSTNNNSANSGNLAGQAKLDDLNRQLTLASESLTARTQENNELQSRVTELESLLRKKNRLITLKNEQLAELQASLGKPPLPISDDELETDIIASDPALEQGMGIQQQLAEADAPEGTIVRESEDPMAIITDTTQPEIFQPPVTDQLDSQIDSALNAPAAVEEDDGLLSMLSSPLVMGLGAGSLLALLAGFLFMRRRNAKEEYEDYSPIDFDDPTFSPGTSTFGDEPNEPSGDANSSDPFAGLGDTKSPKADFSADPMDELNNEVAAPTPTPVAPKAAAAAPVQDQDQSEDDILQEADVYIVYGLHEQAEVELKKAIASQPDNLEYRAKLLENYHASDNKDAFATEAAEFAKLEGPNKDALWDKVSGWGRKMLPGNSLFSTGGAPDSLKSDISGGMGGVAKAAGAAAVAGGIAVTAGKAIADSGKDKLDDLGDMAGNGLDDLNAGLGDLKDSAADTVGDLTDDLEMPKVETPESLDFDEMDLDSLLASGEIKEETTAGLDGLDDLDLDGLDLDTKAEQVTDELPDADLDNMDFDFSDFELDDDIEDESPVAASADKKEEELTTDFDIDNFDFDNFDDLDLGESNTELLSDLDKNDLSMANLNLALDGSSEGVGKILPENSVYKMAPKAEVATNHDMLGEIDDDLSFLDLETDSDDDLVEAQISTKLDLARAYMDMGDVEGARSTLEEVINEGNDDQRREAEEMLHQAG